MSVSALPLGVAYGTECAADKTGVLSRQGGGLISQWGGVRPYTLNWSNGQIGVFRLNNIASGTYTLKVSDACGTSVSKDYIVPTSDSLSAVGFNDISFDPSTNRLIASSSGGFLGEINTSTGHFKPILVSSNIGSSPLTIGPKTVEPYRYSWNSNKGMMDTITSKLRVKIDSTNTWSVTITDYCGTKIKPAIRQ